MKKIKNREELIEQLADMMIDLDAEGNLYQTDIYLYVDDEGNGTLDTYQNVGGNSWLDDDHITIYSDMPHYNDIPAEEYGVKEEEYRDYLDECRDNYLDTAEKLLNDVETYY